MATLDATAKSGTGVLIQLLTDLFDKPQLHTFVETYYESVVPDLEDKTLTTMARSFVVRLDEDGALEADLFERLAETREGRADDIEAARSVILGRPSGEGRSGRVGSRLAPRASRTPAKNPRAAPGRRSEDSAHLARLLGDAVKLRSHCDKLIELAHWTEGHLQSASDTRRGRSGPISRVFRIFFGPAPRPVLEVVRPVLDPLRRLTDDVRDDVDGLAASIDAIGGLDQNSPVEDDIASMKHDLDSSLEGDIGRFVRIDDVRAIEDELRALIRAVNRTNRKNGFVIGSLADSLTRVARQALDTAEEFCGACDKLFELTTHSLSSDAGWAVVSPAFADLPTRRDIVSDLTIVRRGDRELSDQLDRFDQGRDRMQTAIEGSVAEEAKGAALEMWSAASRVRGLVKAELADQLRRF